MQDSERLASEKSFEGTQVAPTWAGNLDEQLSMSWHGHSTELVAWCTIHQPPPCLKVTKRARQHEHPGGGKEEGRKDQHLGSKLLECTALPPCLPQKQSERHHLPHWRRGPVHLCHTTPFSSSPRGVGGGALWESEERGKRAANLSMNWKSERENAGQKEVVDVALLSHTAAWTVHSTSTSKPAKGPDPHSWSLAAASNRSFSNGILLAII